ncbi:YfjI family protein [Bacillus sp. AFS017336]|uniref:YfjI family protein n=1 Tax=Bacillus sp. AFS017336 TaxID=2033489 RepID=UPI000BF2433F|nr:YfjI family protein [Bacillus sp. AFS017336]PEK99495.1 hypothetical protein CN601_23790 [Bacillus sp. AFS017336]
MNFDLNDLQNYFSKEDFINEDILSSQQIENMSNDVWEEPVQFENYDVPSFPIKIFPNWIKEFIESVAETTQTPVDAAAMIALSIISTACAKKIKINPHGDWYEPVNLFMVVILSPANRKSAVFTLMQEPLLLFEKEIRENNKKLILKQSTEKGALIKRKDRLENEYSKNGDSEILEELIILNEEIESKEVNITQRLITDDVTSEKLVSLLVENNEKMAILSAEGGIFDNIAGRYSKNSKPNLEIYLKSYSGDYCAVDRMGRTETLNNPALTIGLFIQPDVIMGLPTTFIKRGLLGRFLFSMPKSLIGYRRVRPKSLNKDMKNIYYENIYKILRFNVDKEIVLKFSNQANAKFKEFEEKIELALREDGKLSDIEHWGGKLAGQLVRIAGLLHITKILEVNSNAEITCEDILIEIDSDIIMNTIELAYYFYGHAINAFKEMKMDLKINDVKYLLKKIKSYQLNEISYRRIQQDTKTKFNSDYLKQLLVVLEEHKYIKFYKDGLSGNKGTIKVSPLFLKD